jgi:hypothetical protein
MNGTDPAGDTVKKMRNSRRKKLIDEICKTADAQHKDPVEIAQQFEDERLSKGKSLNWMWETWVMERRKGRA